ncbi:hypothetical protein [Catenulispora yoronensis]
MFDSADESHVHPHAEQADVDAHRDPDAESDTDHGSAASVLPRGS